MEPTLLITLVVVVLALAGAVQSKLDRTDRRIARLNRKVDLILDHLHIQEFGSAELHSVGMLTQQGKRIEAIKLYRQITGTGLKEAKEAVDAMAGTR